MKNLKKIKYLFLLSLFFISACAKTSLVPPTDLPLSDEQARARWEQMISQTPSAAPFLVDGSARVGIEGETQRVNFLSWGYEELPIRLDLLYIHTVLFQAYQDRNGIVLYLPTEDRVFYYNTFAEAFETFNVTLPFGLDTLMALTQGRFPIANSSINYTSAGFNPEENLYIYSIPYSQSGDNSFYGTWTLDELARPVLWEYQDWEIEFSYEENSLKPDKIDGMSTNSQIFTLFIGDNTNPTSFADDNLMFVIPTHLQ